MGKSILITGIAGSGKSAVCDELNSLGYKAFGIEDIGLCFWKDKKTGKRVRNFDSNNLKSVNKTSWICDKKRLQELMKKNSKEITFYGGIVSNLNDLFPLFDKILLLKANKKTLGQRLSTRTSNNFGRTSEVQKWLFSWKKDWENNMKEKGAIVINANQNLQKVVKDILKRL